MRDILNAILAFIGSESLTDDEYGEISGGDLSTDEKRYAALDTVLVSREAVSGIRDRLKYYFMAKGVSVGEVDTSASNIFVGSGIS